MDFRKRNIKPTTEWQRQNMKRDNQGGFVPILDLCTKAESVLFLPVGRLFKDNDYIIFSVHTLIEESGFSMSFQVWKKFQPGTTSHGTEDKTNQDCE